MEIVEGLPKGARDGMGWDEMIRKEISSRDGREDICHYCRWKVADGMLDDSSNCLGFPQAVPDSISFKFSTIKAAFLADSLWRSQMAITR